MRGVTTQSPTLASIHVNCTPRLPSREQAIVINPDLMARAARVPSGYVF